MVVGWAAKLLLLCVGFSLIFLSLCSKNSILFCRLFCLFTMNAPGSLRSLRTVPR
jgi:hypothetical protein